MFIAFVIFVCFINVCFEEEEKEEVGGGAITL